MRAIDVLGPDVRPMKRQSPDFAAMAVALLSTNGSSASPCERSEGPSISGTFGRPGGTGQILDA